MKFAKRSFKGGVHPPKNKLTSDKPITEINDIALVRIPMNMSVGAPCKPIVKAGDLVKIGQVIAEPSGISVPIHASISGKVKAVKTEYMGTGDLMVLVDIENDFENAIHESVVPPVVSDYPSFIAAVKASGMVGLGGAGFPTHIKLQPPADKKSNLLLINGMECEPYITSDDRQMVEEPRSIIKGILTILKYMDIPNAIIGVEDNKPEAIKALREEVARTNSIDRIEVRESAVRYPHGAERVMIQSLTGRIVPAQGLPCDVNVTVLNVSTVNYINKYLETGMPMVRRVLTLTGDCPANPGNYIVPIGTRIADLLEKTGGTVTDPKKVLMGGPMMGLSMSDYTTPIVKNNNAIILMDKGAILPEETPCISCGRCVDACPANLMPNILNKATKKKDFDRLDDFAVMNCFECGSCAYVCPAKIQLVQSIRSGKSFYRAQLAKIKKEREAAV